MQGGIVKLVDINDYITPNQSCIKSLAETVKGKKGNEIKFKRKKFGTKFFYQ